MGQLLCCLQVNQATLGVRERWGKFEEVLEPGCHCIDWVFGSRVAGYLSTRVRQLDVHCEAKTKVFKLLVISQEVLGIFPCGKETHFP